MGRRVNMNKDFVCTITITALIDFITEQPVEEFVQLCNMLNIALDFDWLNKYHYKTKLGTGDVLVFSENIEKGKFIVIDDYHGRTDQNEMVMFGVHCLSAEWRSIEPCIMEIYDNSDVKSSIYEIDLADFILEEHYPKMRHEYGYTDLNNLENKKIAYTYLQEIKYITDDNIIP